MSRAKQVRVLLLLLLLTPLVFIFRLPSSPAPSWSSPVVVAIYPYNSDGSDATEAYIRQLEENYFKRIEEYFQSQAARHGLTIIPPFDFRLAQPIKNSPPMPDRTSTALGALKWGLSVRWWHAWFDKQDLDPDIVVVARYQATSEGMIHLHSVGMPNPRLALVNLIADERVNQLNQVTLAHEMLHTVGANDLYASPGGYPTWPDGFANPDREPLYPQNRAELMAGRIPLSPEIAREARSLDEVVIGPQTARAIGWFAP